MTSPFDTRPAPVPPGSAPPPTLELDPAAAQGLADGSVRRLLLRDGCVLTQDPELGDLPRADVLVEGERIVAVGTDLPDHVVAGAVVLDVSGHVVLPGFVDAHVHAWEGLLRGVAPTVDFGEYLGLTAFGYGPHYLPEDMYAGTFATALVALDGGTTALVDNSHNALTPDHGRAAVEALLDAGIRGVHAIGSPFGTDLEHVRSTATALRDRYGADLLQVRLFDIHPTADLWAFAQAEEMWVSSEVGPHTPDVDDLLADLSRRGLLGPHHALNHCYDLQERTWDVIRDSGASVNLAPRSDAAFGLGSTVLPAAQALSRGIPVGLSGDNEVSYGLSMFAEMQNLLSRTRSEEFRRRAGGADPDGAALLTPADALRAATIGGAANAGLADRVGSLTPGKQADLQVVRTDGIATSGVLDATGAVTAFAHAGSVDTVLVAGRLRKHRGVLVGVDLPSVRSMVAARQQALWDR
jgi:cytosine/adenosine deaminase-related metal-dependent hydrolase